MATTTVTLTGDVADAIGIDFDARRTKVYVRYNTTTVVTDSGPIRLGGGNVTPESDGTFELPDVVASTSLVENLQATVVVDYPDRTSRGGRDTATFGPYDLTGLSGTVDIRTIEAVQHLDASRASELLAEMEAIRDETQAARDQAVDLSNIDTSAEAVAAGFQIPGSASGEYLSATIATQVPLTAFGTGDASDLLAAAAASGEMDFYLPPGNYTLDETWAPPAGSRWTLAKNARLLPAGNFDVLLAPAFGLVQGGQIDVSGLSSFTKAAVLYSGHYPGGAHHTVSGMRLHGKSINDAGSAAVRLVCPGGAGQYIDWVVGSNLYMANFEKLVHIDSTTPGAWINGNIFRDAILGACKDAFYVDGVGGLGADGNYFSFMGQANVGGVRTIYCSSDYNQFDGFVFDVATGGRTPLHAEFTPTSQRNNLIAPPSLARHVKDNGYDNSVAGRSFENHANVAFEPVAPFSRDPANVNTVGAKLVGDQDDFLAWSGRTGRHAVAQTQGNAVTVSLTYMFDLDRALASVWNTTPTDPDIVVELTLTETMNPPKLMGLVFEYGQRPQKIVAELINGATATTAFTTTTNDKDVVTFSTVGLVSTSTKLRITMGNPKNGANIRLNRWWAAAGDKPGKAWVSRHAPAITGAATLTAPVAGGAAALPATPAGYYTLNINGTNRQVPYY
jgi:hypothetical protein